MRIGTILNVTRALKGFRFHENEVLLKLAEQLIRAGAEHIELTGDHFDVEVYEEGYIQQQINALLPLKRTGITFSLHAPCVNGIMTGSNHISIRKGSVQTILDAWRLIKPLDPLHMVKHPEALDYILKELKLNSFMAKSFVFGLIREYEKESLTELSREVPPEKICMENQPIHNSKQFRKIVKENGISVTYDIGHHLLQALGPESHLPSGLARLNKEGPHECQEGLIEHFFSIWRERIKNIHFHNVSVSQRLESGLVVLADHQPITDPRGLIDAKRVCRKLKELGYSGPIVLEEYHNLDASESISHLKNVISQI